METNKSSVWKQNSEYRTGREGRRVLVNLDVSEDVRRSPGQEVSRSGSESEDESDGFILEPGSGCFLTD